MTTKGIAAAHHPPLAEYAYGWCLHQLAPFLDKFFGVAGAMDHRMIDRDYDWHIRLPLVLLSMVFPNRLVLLVAHVVNIACWFDRMPAVWDYMCWCALLEATFVLAVLASRSSEEVTAKFLPAARAQLLVLYSSAAFWKLTTSWFDPHYSCATVLTAELLSGLERLVPPVAHLSGAMLAVAPALVAGIEFAVPTLLLLRPRWGVFLALVFHQTVNLMPATYAGGFGLAMCARMTLFLPGCLGDAQRSSHLLPSMGLVGLATTFMYGIHDGLDFHGGIFLFLALFYFMALSADIFDEHPHASMLKPASFALPKVALVTALCLRGRWDSAGAALALLAAWAPRSPWDFALRALPGLSGLAVALGFWYGYMHPVLGLQMMASSTMYGNVRNFGASNHLLVPTGLLQEWLASPAVAADAPAWLSDFAGGLVRVEHTTSPTFRQLAVRGAEVTGQLPPRARELLASVNASGRYFEFYSARNYFDRPGDLQACALNAVEEGNASGAATAAEDERYVVPAFELRRALALARGRREAFRLEYTRLPAELRLPRGWRAHRGPRVVLEEPGGAAPATCKVVSPGAEVAECGASELSALPPPGPWPGKLLIPYPFPLVDGAGDEVHCST